MFVVVFTVIARGLAPAVTLVVVNVAAPSPLLATQAKLWTWSTAISKGETPVTA